MIDRAFYDGRGQALVKHTFIDQYMRDQLPKVGRFGTVAYVDLFAGPWQSRAPDFADTSFGIALRRMTETKALLAKQGKDVRMIAHLVEKENHEALVEATKQFHDVEVRCYRGRAEDHATTIASGIPASAFRFVVIDPKGLPDVRQFRSLVAAPKTEVLLNFMFQFASRFVATDKMPALIDWLGTVAPGNDWQAQVDRLSGEERERFITNMARDVMMQMGEYKFGPAITVDETVSDRCLYKLIYLTRHELGLRVFRDAATKTLEVQAEHRTTAKAAKRQAKTGMEDMFGTEGVGDPFERSARAIALGRAAGTHFAASVVEKAGTKGLSWKQLWTQVLDGWAITHKDLSDFIVAEHRAGKLDIDGLVHPARTPKNDHIIRRRMI